MNMKILIEQSQVKRVIYKYLDSVFKDAVFTNWDDGQPWEGFIIPQKDTNQIESLIARPVGDDNWYSNGYYFHTLWEVMGIGAVTFHEILSKYIREKYNIDMGLIM